MKTENIIFVISLVVVTGVLGGVFYYVKAQEKPASLVKDTAVTPTPERGLSEYTELIKEDTLVGNGATAETNSKVTVNYTGKLLDGTTFDSNAGKAPITFELTVGKVIDGWVQGIPGMKVGGKRTLKVPYSLAYGESGRGNIKPYSDLIFDVELVGVE